MPKGRTALEAGDLAKVQVKRQKAKGEKLARAQAKKAKEEKQPAELLAVMEKLLALETKKKKKAPLSKPATKIAEEQGGCTGGKHSSEKQDEAWCDDASIDFNLHLNNLDMISPNACLFIMKAFCEDDVHKSIKYGIWSSSEINNMVLSTRWQESNAENIPIYLLFSVNQRCVDVLSI